MSGLAVSCGPSAKPRIELRTVVVRFDSGTMSSQVSWVCDGEGVAMYGDTQQEAFEAWQAARAVEQPKPRRWSWWPFAPQSE